MLYPNKLFQNSWLWCDSWEGNVDVPKNARIMTHHSPRSHFVPKVTSKNKTSICHRVSTSFEEVCVLCPYFFERVSVFQFPQGFGSFGLSSKFVESRKLLLVGEEFPTLAPTTDEQFDSQTPTLPSETLSRWNLRTTLFLTFTNLILEPEWWL